MHLRVDTGCIRNNDGDNKRLPAEGGSAGIGAARQALQSVGGSLEAFYYSNGEEDFCIIVNLPAPGWVEARDKTRGVLPF